MRLRVAYIVTEQANEIHHTRELDISKPVRSTCALEDAFEHAVVRFTHFIKAVDDSVIGKRSMVSGFLRGVAFMCHNHRKDIDIVIPVLLDKRYVLKESSMSALFVQVKRRRPGSSTACIIYERVHGFFPNKQQKVVSTREQEDTRPFVTLVAELGIDNPLGK